MHVIHVAGVNDAYRQGMTYLAQNMVTQDSRNGTAYVAPVPVTTHYARPTQRVLLDSKRDANPFFHLFEALWMLAGRNDVAFVSQFAKNIAKYSDDGQTFHGAYGFRWREHWAIDQVEVAVQMLRADPGSRRVVISMWDPAVDLNTESADIPCNDLIKLWIRQGHLNMAVFNRSNDIIWGAYGANMVHFSMLQEYIAARVGASVGFYEQVSCDFHAYAGEWEKRWPLPMGEPHPYWNGLVVATPLVREPATFDRELLYFIRYMGNIEPAELHEFTNPFFTDVAYPMLVAHRQHKAGATLDAWQMLTDLTEEQPIDWLVAGREWLARRANV